MWRDTQLANKAATLVAATAAHLEAVTRATWANESLVTLRARREQAVDWDVIVRARWEFDDSTRLRADEQSIAASMALEVESKSLSEVRVPELLNGIHVVFGAGHTASV